MTSSVESMHLWLKVGICLDLCPEKERYRRMVQHDISSFELEDGLTRMEKCMKVILMTFKNDKTKMFHKTWSLILVSIRINYKYKAYQVIE